MDRKSINRRQNILLLIELYLTENGFHQSAKCLKDEAKLSIDRVICDNINLETIIIEYESFYFHRFKKHPRISKTVDINQYNLKTQNFNSNIELGKTNNIKATINAKKSSQISGNAIVKSNSLNKISTDDYFRMDGNLDYYSNIIIQCIGQKNAQASWENIKGLEQEKELLKEAIIYPIKYPHLFQGTVESWKSILLYGPPGTGKSLLAATVANESVATFFSIAASSIISKWRGDTERLIKVLFDTAEQYAPSIIFIDEFDSFASKRNSFEHEASRRMKSEIFLRIDELIHSSNKVFFLAATNSPWDLDESMLRRFEKQIYIEPPNESTRKLLLESYLPKVISEYPRIETCVDFNYLAQLTKNYSGCDIKNICKEIKMKQVRQILRKLETNGSKNDFPININIRTFNVEEELKNFKPTISGLAKKYTEWKLHVPKNLLQNNNE